MPGAKSCAKCGTKKKCHGSHVYAVELDQKVLEDEKFSRKCGLFPNFAGRCFYVGSTSAHRVECRYKQHRLRKRTRRKAGASFGCTCKTGIEKQVSCHWSNKGNSWVRKWGKGLAYDLFADWNPLPKGKMPVEAEAELAERLRQMGYAVYTDAKLAGHECY